MIQILNIQFLVFSFLDQLPTSKGEFFLCVGGVGVMCKSVLPAKLREPWGEDEGHIAQELSEEFLLSQV